ncbi:MAG: hypothetical protein ACT4N4_08965 [Rhodospirillales bacterium]
MKPFLLALSACLLAAGPAWALERNCDYDIKVKSDAEGINSFTIPNGRIQSNGDVSTSSVARDSTAKSGARYYAGEAAGKCFNDAVRHPGRPDSCRINTNPTDGTGAMSLYNITNLRQIALNALCQQARTLGKGPRIRDYTIWLHTLGDGDVRSQCSDFLKIRVGAGRDLTCSAEGTAVLGGGAQPAQQQSQRPAPQPMPQQQAQQQAQQPRSYLMTCNPGAGMRAVLNGAGRGTELIIQYNAGTQAASAGVPNGACTWSDRGLHPDEPKALCVDSSKIGRIAFYLESPYRLTGFDAANAPYLNSFAKGETFQVHVFNDQAKNCMRITRSGP